MTYLIGAVLGAVGAYLAVAAQARRSQVRAARAQAVRLGLPEERPVEANSVAALGEMVAPIVLVALGWFTLKLCFAFYILPPSDYFTIVDLAGTLVLVGGYASWLLAKTHYRMPDLQEHANVVTDPARAAFEQVARPAPERISDRPIAEPIYAAARAAPSAHISASLE